MFYKSKYVGLIMVFSFFDFLVSEIVADKFV
jgi:hypothetical protein